MKQSSSLDSSTSTVALRRDVRQAADDEAIDAVLLKIDSPGGTVAGTADLAADVQTLGTTKPTFAYVEDFCASAAYWIASQCNRLYANNGTAKIGSIGTLLAFYDVSKMAKNEGIEPVVISTGPYKATGFPGTKVTDDQKAKLQNLIDQTQAFFANAVALGRGLPLQSVNDLATGEMFSAGDSQSNGLIDEIADIDAAMNALIARVPKSEKSDGIELPTIAGSSTQAGTLARAWTATKLDDLAEAFAGLNQQERTRMTGKDNHNTMNPINPASQGQASASPTQSQGEHTPEPTTQPNLQLTEQTGSEPEEADGSRQDSGDAGVAGKIGAPTQDKSQANAKTASLSEIEQALPKADAQFQIDCLKSNCTLEQAKDRWINHCESRLDELEDQTAKANAAAQSLRGDDGSVEFQTADQSPEQQAGGDYEGKMADGVARFAASINLPQNASNN